MGKLLFVGCKHGSGPHYSKDCSSTGKCQVVPTEAANGSTGDTHTLTAGLG
jgi:hypothetical protein